jgi:hypothetical protein
MFGADRNVEAVVMLYADAAAEMSYRAKSHFKGRSNT